MNSAVFTKRREQARAELGSAVLVCFAAHRARRNNDVEHPYRQDSDFYYLTGFDEPDAALVLTADTYVIFLRERNPEREVWDGTRVGLDGAKTLLGASDSHPIADLSTQLPELLKGYDTLYYAMAETEQVDRKIMRSLQRARQLTRKGGTAPSSVVDSRRILHEARRRKSVDEISLMQTAADISTRAHQQAMAQASPGVYEYELQATIEGAFAGAGAPRPAYQSIVGAGVNATILHYITNRAELKADELVLIDAGCEYQYYAADITRTFPVSGKFSQPQQALYEIVLAAQLAAIEIARPGATFVQIHDTAVRVITQGLLDLKLIDGDLEGAIEKKLFMPFYMHSTGHYLGMDVHDVGSYFVGKTPRPLDEGCVITIEPGLYVAADAAVDPKYQGIGIRIEDDLLLTTTGNSNLTGGLAKTVSEVEAACAAKN